jgi:hypothetical protein
VGDDGVERDVRSMQTRCVLTARSGTVPVADMRLREALGLVDRMIDCRAQLDGAFDDNWRAHLEQSFAVCSEKIRGYVEAPATDSGRAGLGED